MTKIIVLTPVKNEGWILEQFLAIASFFADCIIVADQNSTDESKLICSRFPKVHIVENNGDFNEDGRQILLIETARHMFPDVKRVLFCLDADEIFSSDSLNHCISWDRIRTAEPGTSIYIEKPNLLNGLQKCIRWKNNYFPIAYVDDGRPHTPKVIHSRRIPDNPQGEKLYIEDIKVLHFAQTRRKVQSAKLRYYSVIENIKNNNPVYLRRYSYQCFYDDAQYPNDNIEEIPSPWLKGWDERNINLRTLPDVEFSWHDFEVLCYFKKYGFKRFYFDDIWDFDWESCRQCALQSGKDAPVGHIKRPGILFTGTAKMIDRLYSFYRRIS